MLETISRLESTERTEAYGYLQNCVNVLGVHKLGLSRMFLTPYLSCKMILNFINQNSMALKIFSEADIASLLHKPDMTSSSKVNTTQESTNQVKVHMIILHISIFAV